MKQLERISAFFLALALMAIGGCGSTPTQEGPGAYLNDALITTKVKAALFREPSLKSAEINVETIKGAVQLSGVVHSRLNLTKAIFVARDVSGVRSVENDLQVKK